MRDDLIAIRDGKGPVQSNDPNNNKPINPALLNELRAHWLALSFAELDKKLVQLRKKYDHKTYLN
jgi:hypothetical protein